MKVKIGDREYTIAFIYQSWAPRFWPNGAVEASQTTDGDTGLYKWRICPQITCVITYGDDMYTGVAQQSPHQPYVRKKLRALAMTRCLMGEAAADGNPNFVRAERAAFWNAVLSKKPQNPPKAEREEAVG